MGSWTWFSSGKHPVVGDFFQVGHESPLATHFQWWVEKGYDGVLRQGRGNPEVNSWRFWSHGARNDELVLGLVRDSGDSRGRPYPILFIGCGTLKTWASQWELLPLVCEQAWSQAEHLAVRRLESLEDFKEGLAKLRAPGSDWTAARKTFSRAFAGSADDQIQKDPSSQQDHNQTMSYRITPREGSSSAALVARCHDRLKTLFRNIRPQTVFMGGNASTLHVQGFFRSITPADFTAMWSLR